MWFELVALIMGIAFGYLRSGKEDLVTLIKQGLYIGIGIGIILAILSIVTYDGMSSSSGVVGAIDVSVRVIILAIVFIIGVMIGDLLESRKRP
ncbi:MAG: hypothetical protein LUQ37_03685 [Methanoregulaceae archaeon]|jgi:hypothetical protein|nr:hypothetical protein [Methanoregulaceae archaeon]